MVAVRVQRFETGDGAQIERQIGFALVTVGDRSAPTLVVYADEVDRTVLGAMALSALGLRVGDEQQELVDAGPVPAPSNVLA